MNATNTGLLTPTPEPKEMYTAAQMKDMDRGPSFLAPLIEKMEQRSGTQWPWRHSVATYLVNLQLLKKTAKAEGLDVAAMVTRQRAMALCDFLCLLERNFREDTGGESTEGGWRLVAMKGGWLHQTVVNKSDDEAVVYIDSSYFFEKIA